MNIVEREINRREALIQTRENKLAEAEELLARAAALKAEYEPISVDTLLAEIEELKTYLPQMEENNGNISENS
ncbi:MAG TPA: hypothetical protein GX745_09080 [Clostridiales bacterium]|jgi:hypothetical protein|nr:hypothetical protein [Clostridiales bacterium]